MPNRKTIGFIIPNIIHPNESRVWAALEREAVSRNVNLISIIGAELNPNDDFCVSANAIYRLVRPPEVEGILIWTSLMGLNVTQEEISLFIKGLGVPVISVDSVLPGIPSVVPDNYGGICMVIEHMIKIHGKRRIGFIRGPENSFVAELRFRAYKDALQRNGIDLDQSLITPAASWMDTESIKILIDKKSGMFDCIASVSDYKAFTVMEELLRSGVRIPEDVAVVGFDNDSRGRILSRSLTSIDPDHISACVCGLDLLLDAFNGGSLPAETVVPSRLIIGETCGCISNCVSSIRRHNSSGVIRKRTDHKGETDEDKRLREIFSRSLAGTVSEVTFIHALEDLVETSFKSFEDEEIWYQRILDLRRDYLFGRLRSWRTETIEELILQAQIVVSLAAARKVALRNLERDRFRNEFLEVCRNLVSTHHLEEIFSRCDEGFRRIGISSFGIKLYSDTNDPAKGSRTAMISLSGDTVFVPKESGLITDKLIPGEFVNLTESYRLVAMPLFFDKDQIGLVFFGDGPDEGGIYELLRGQLSSAIKGALLVRQLRDRADILSGGIQNLTLNLKSMIESSEAIEENMEVQSSAVNGQAGSLEAMFQNIKLIADMTIKSNSLSEEFRSAAGKGQTAFQNSVESINTIAEHSQKILEVLSIIKKIAFQTNLLAMNASIEAAHAGQFGKGFAVVADEVRRLAENADMSVQKIQASIKMIVHDIEISVTHNKDATRSLAEIMQYAESNATIANQLKLSMTEQELGASKMLTAMQNLLRITEEVNGNIKAQKDSIVEFNNLLHMLNILNDDN